MVTIHKNFIGFGSVVDFYSSGKRMRKYEIGFNDPGLFIAKNKSRDDLAWWFEMPWIAIVLVLIIQNLILNLILILK